MLTWLKKTFGKKTESNPYIGVFTDWELHRHFIASPCGRYCLWTSNGFNYFEDWDRTYKPKHLQNVPNVPILTFMDTKTKRLLWDAVTHDLQQKAKENFLAFKKDLVKNVEF